MEEKNSGFLNILIFGGLLFLGFHYLGNMSKVEINADLNSNKLWQTATNSSMPIFLFFYADYCGTCQRMKPMIYKIADDFSGQYTFLPIDVTDQNNSDLTRKFHISVIPEIYLVNHMTKKYKKLTLESDPEYYKKNLEEFTGLSPKNH